MASPRVIVMVLGPLREELLPQRLQDACWNSRHGPSPVTERQQLHDGDAVPAPVITRPTGGRSYIR